MKKSFSIFVMMILSVIMMSFIQTATITGRVTDEQSQPLAGVSVSVKGSGYSTRTDNNGIYRITVGQNDRVLIFTLKGFMTEEVNINSRTTINVVLRSGIVQENELLAPVFGAGNEMMFAEAQAVMDVSYRSKAYFPGYNGNFNTEGYAPVNENGYRSVKNNPLSTFSIDVDNASWSNIRRFINGGSLPPPDAVRIEEMINYFRYDYPEPAGEHPFSVFTEVSSCPWNDNHRLLHIGLRGKNIDKSSLPPSNLVFLLDVSGSMDQHNKLPLLKSAFGLLVNELRPQDRVAIVVYAGAAGLVLESTPGNRKEAIMSAIDRLQAGGSTAGGAGLRLAYKAVSYTHLTLPTNREV